MKKLRTILAILLVAVNLSGCAVSREQSSNRNDDNTKNNSGELISNTNINDTNRQNYEMVNKDKLIITDIKNWVHPTKEIFAQNGLKIVKIELTKNGTYPTFVLDNISDYYFEDIDFLNSLAKENGYWDFKLTDNIKYLEVYCDKKNKIIYKTVSNQKTTSISDYAFTKYNGVWFATSFANKNKNFSKLTLKFKENNKASIELESFTNETGHAKIMKDVVFDFSRSAKLMVTDSAGNKINAIVSIEDENLINFALLPDSTIKNKKSIFTSGFGRYAKEADFLNLQTSMKILEKKYGYKDMSTGLYIPKTKDDSVYFDFENRTEDGRYRIAVRRCKDTSICNWYIINPVTEEIEIEN